MKKSWSKGSVNFFSVDLNPIDANDILDMHKCLMKKTWCITLMKENLIQINGGITIDVDVGVKNIIYVKKIIFEILWHVVAKMENV